MMISSQNTQQQLKQPGITPIQPQISRVSTNKSKKSPVSDIKKISYSGELDDDKDDIDINDDDSIQSYQPENSDFQDQMSNETSNKFSRVISREDASSIIGGLNIQHTATNNVNSRISLSPRIPPTRVPKKTDIPLSKRVNTNLNGLLAEQPITPQSESEEEFTDSEIINANINDDTKKVFNFSLPFSNPTNPVEDGEEEEDYEDQGAISQTTTRTEYFQPVNTIPVTNHKETTHHHHNIPILSKTFKKISNMLPFPKKSQSKESSERPPLLRRSSHPEAPSPPPGVYVYWDDIAHKVVPDEMADREDVRLKLERQESLDTLQEARYYKDIRHLDDGKMKALRQSIMPRAPSLAISQSITSKISYVTTKIRSDSLTTSAPETIPEAQEKVDFANHKDGSVSPIASTSVGVSALSHNNKSTSSLNNSFDSTLIDKENNSNPVMSTLTTATKFLSSVPMSPINSISSMAQPPTEPITTEIFDELDGDVLVIGGYRGSILRDSKTHRRTWIPILKAGLNIRKINLVLGPHDEDEMKLLNARDVVFNKDSKIKPGDKDYPEEYPDGMITHIGPVDIARRLLKKLNANPNVHATDWGYDWRLSPELISKKLHEKLKEIVSKQKNKKGVLLIAHSMGGIVAHGAMVIDPSLVRGIVYAGTPMPCGNILGPMRFTDAILLSRDILTHEANFFMRSSFVFIPPSWGGEDENGEGGGMTLYRDLRTGKRMKIDFWDEENWVLYNLSPLVSSVRLKHDVANGVINLHHMKDQNLKHLIKKFLKFKIDPETEVIVLDEISRLHEPVVSWIDAYQYLAKTLRRTKRFLKTLERKDDVVYPPMSQIFSNGVPSVKYSLVDGEECIKRGEYYKFFYGPGDGVVYQGWNFPRERGRKRLEGPDKCGEGSVDTVANISDWRGREYGFGEKYSYDLCGRFRATCGHIGLLVDLNLVGQAIECLLVEERRILES